VRRSRRVRAGSSTRFAVRAAGYGGGMADPVEKVKDVAGATAHPVETAHGLAAEAARGRSARTPLIAISGVTIAISVVLALLLVVLFLIYYLV